MNEVMSVSLTFAMIAILCIDGIVSDWLLYKSKAIREVWSASAPWMMLVPLLISVTFWCFTFVMPLLLMLFLYNRWLCFKSPNFWGVIFPLYVYVSLKLHESNRRL